jgi:hypothetical protein
MTIFMPYTWEFRFAPIFLSMLLEYPIGWMSDGSASLAPSNSCRALVLTLVAVHPASCLIRSFVLIIFWPLRHSL